MLKEKTNKKENLCGMFLHIHFVAIKIELFHMTTVFPDTLFSSHAL
jgi:hypothetical protein